MEATNKIKMENYNSITTSIIKEIDRIKEQIIHKVLLQYLEREPIESDWKLCELGCYYNNPNDMQLKYNGVILGNIIVNMPKYSFCEDFGKLSIDFIPAKIK